MNRLLRARGAEERSGRVMAMTRRDYSGLPDDVLLSVLRRLIIPSTTFRDLFAFASVCTAWRSLARSVITAPFLLHFQLPTDDNASSLCKLKSFDQQYSPSSFNSMLPSGRARSMNCIGYSHGHLIFAAREALIFNVFTGHEIRPPPIPIPYSRYSFAILTAAPSSPSSYALLVVDWTETHILCWRPPEIHWSVLKLDQGNDSDEEEPRVLSLCSFNGTVYGVLSRGRAFVLELGASTANVGWRMLDVKLPNAQNLRVVPRMTTRLRKVKDLKGRTAGTHLVDWNGELLLVLFVWKNDDHRRVKVYWLDFAKREWAEVRSLGDGCLFMDTVGRCHLACRVPPSIWGGRSNCIYVAGAAGTWSVIPLGGKAFANFDLSRTIWPSSVWVYPSMLQS